MWPQSPAPAEPGAPGVGRGEVTARLRPAPQPRAGRTGRVPVTHRPPPSPDPTGQGSGVRVLIGREGSTSRGSTSAPSFQFPHPRDGSSAPPTPPQAAEGRAGHRDPQEPGGQEPGGPGQAAVGPDTPPLQVPAGASGGVSASLAGWRAEAEAQAPERRVCSQFLRARAWGEGRVGFRSAGNTLGPHLLAGAGWGAGRLSRVAAGTRAPHRPGGLGRLDGNSP